MLKRKSINCLPYRRLQVNCRISPALETCQRKRRMFQDIVEHSRDVKKSKLTCQRSGLHQYLLQDASKEMREKKPECVPDDSMKENMG